MGAADNGKFGDASVGFKGINKGDLADILGRYAKEGIDDNRFILGRPPVLCE